jgi:hypothetical protein
MKEFAQLQEDVNPETAQWDEAADDNDKSGLELKRMGAGTEERSVGDKMTQMIEALE